MKEKGLKMTMKRTVTVGAIALSMTLSGCGSAGAETAIGETWDDIVSAAQDEGSVTYYTSGNENKAQLLGESFKEQYGITVNVVYLTSNELSERLSAESRSGNYQADLVNIAERPLLDTMAEADQLHQLSGPNFESLPDGVSTEYTVEAGRTFLSAMHSADIENVPETWEDVLESGNQGNIGVADPEGSTVYALGFHWMHNNIPNFMERLGDLEPKFVQSLATSVPMIEGGQVEITVPTTAWFSFAQANDLDSIEATIPTPGLYYARYGSVIKGAQNPNAAMLLNDYILSCEGQDFINGEQLGTSAFCNLDTDIQPPDEAVDIWAGIEDAAEELAPTLDAYSANVAN